MIAWLLDANAVIDFYEGNDRGQRVEQALREQRGHWFLTTYGALEVFGVLARSRRRGDISDEVYRLVVRQLEYDLSSLGWIHLLPIRNRFYPRCRLLLDVHAVGGGYALSAADSLHLLAALDLRRRYPEVRLVTSDAALSNIARAEGLVVFDPCGS